MNTNNYQLLQKSSYSPYKHSAYSGQAIENNLYKSMRKDNTLGNTSNSSELSPKYNLVIYPSEKYSLNLTLPSSTTDAISYFENGEKKMKKISDEHGSLRRTFDLRTSNKLKDFIIGQIEQENNKNKYDIYLNKSYDKPINRENFNSPVRSRKNSFRNHELSQKLKRYEKTVDQLATQVQNTNKISQQIEKLKNQRKKRKSDRQVQDYSTSNISNSYSNVDHYAHLDNSSYLKPYTGSNHLNIYNTGTESNRQLCQVKKFDSAYIPKYTSDRYKKQEQIFSPSKNKYETFNQIEKKYSREQYKAENIDTKYKRTHDKSSIQKKKYSKEKYAHKSYEQSKPYEYFNITKYDSKGITSPYPEINLFKSPLKHSEKIQLNQFVLGKVLGEGKFGTCYQAFHKSTGWIYAIKKIPKEIIKSHFMIDQFVLELKIQTFLNHENILKIYTQFDDRTYFYLVLQYMQEGTLFSHLKKTQTIPQKQAVVYIKQVSSAVAYLHANKIAHRDIKPQNIVMSYNVCKLCDFGWATICDQRRKTYCGTFDYAPPQILSGEEYDFTVDLWSLGVLAYELLMGKAPFYHLSRKETMKKILNVENTALQYSRNISKEAISFIQSLIRRDPNERLSSQKLLSHPFLNQIKESQKIRFI